VSSSEVTLQAEVEVHATTLLGNCVKTALHHMSAQPDTHQGNNPESTEDTQLMLKDI
jgi:hypothetical protein